MKLTSLILAVSLAAPIAAQSSTPASSFAVIPPSVAAGLHGRSGPETIDLLEAAKGIAHAQPHAIPRVHLEGTLPTDPWYPESWASSRDWIKMIQVSIAYRITGDRLYLQAEQRFLDAWLSTYKVSFNAIDETPMDQMILSYDLTREDLPPQLRARMETFLTIMAKGYLQLIEGEKKEDIYNWQSHRIKLALICSYSLNDSALISRSISLLRHHLEGNLLAGNVVIDFPRRDALHYTVYDLEPLAMAALAVRTHNGPDVFSAPNAQGSSIHGAIDWLKPYALGTQEHMEFQRSDVKFDIARGKAGVSGFSGAWNPEQSLLLYGIASNLSGEYASIYRSVQARHTCHTHDWLLALQSAGL